MRQLRLNGHYIYFGGLLQDTKKDQKFSLKIVLECEHINLAKTDEKDYSTIFRRKF